MRIERARLAGFTVVIALGLTGCGPVSESRLKGEYHAETPCAKISLILNSDHSFVQSLQTADGGRKHVTGTWRADNRSDEGLSTRVNFDLAFLDLVNDSRGRVVGGASLVAERVGLSVHIGPVIVACPDSAYEINYVSKSVF